MNNESDIVALFDRLSSEYDSWYQTPLGALADALEQQAVFTLVGEVKDKVALDASCGTGNYALALARRGAQVTAVDASAPMLTLVQMKARQQGVPLSLVRASLERLPFRSGSFELVTCVLGLEFVADPTKAVAELARIQPPSGQLVVGALGRFSLWALGRRFKALLRPSLWRHAHFFSRRELAGLLVGAEYRALTEEQAIFFPSVSSTALLTVLRRFEGVGHRWLPGMAAFLAVAGCRAAVSERQDKNG